MNVSSFDLNHARALHFLLEEAHVARAAQQLGITAAAASNALRRLRDELDDELLVRVGRRLQRTPFADTLRAPARDLLAAAERIVAARSTFSPAESTDVFELISADRIAAFVLPALDALFSARAPRATLRLKLVPNDLSETLGASLSVAISPLAAIDSSLPSEPLFDDRFVCVMRKRHPLTRGRFSRERFAAADHLLVTPRGASDVGFVDEALAMHGLARRVVRTVPTFALAPPLLVASDRIATLPESFALPMLATYGLTTRPPPVTLAPIRTRLAWHARHTNDPRHVWLREMMRQAVAAAR